MNRTLSRKLVRNASFAFQSRSVTEFNPFAHIAVALDAEKKKLGHSFGSLFELEIQNGLYQSGYTNLFEAGDNKAIFPMIVSTHTKDSKNAAEFDAIVYGGRKAFDEFSAQFLDSYTEFPPCALADSDTHSLIVEVKLNAGLLVKWATGEKDKGNKHIFLNPEYNLFCKAVVINGGLESKRFLANMRLENPSEEYAQCIKILKAARINVFYKLWASGETFQDLFEQNRDLNIENKEIKLENKEIKLENKKINAKLDKLLEKFMIT